MAFKPFYCGDIKMIGRLIQQKNIGFDGKNPRNGGFFLHTTGKNGHRCVLIPVNTQLAEVSPVPVFDVPYSQGLDLVHQIVVPVFITDEHPDVWVIAQSQEA